MSAVSRQRPMSLRVLTALLLLIVLVPVCGARSRSHAPVQIAAHRTVTGAWSKISMT
jgi:hypothetical protein